MILNIKQNCLIDVVRAESKEQGKQIIDAIIIIINLIEIIMTVPCAVNKLKLKRPNRNMRKYLPFTI